LLSGRKRLISFALYPIFVGENKRPGHRERRTAPREGSLESMKSLWFQVFIINISEDFFNSRVMKDLLLSSGIGTGI
jgi:hypothetical protein